MAFFFVNRINTILLFDISEKDDLKAVLLFFVKM